MKTDEWNGEHILLKTWWYKLIFLLFIVVIAALNLIPTLFPEMDTKNFPVKNRINLGLDLQGGLYIIMGIELPAVLKESLLRNSRNMLKDYMEEKNFSITDIQYYSESNPEDPQVEISLKDPSQTESFRAELKKEFTYFFRIVQQKKGKFRIAFSTEQIATAKEKTVAQSIEVIRNRIDEFGVSEPTIVSYGQEKILIELPGVKDIESAKSLIGQTAKLEFQIVERKKMSPGELTKKIDGVMAANKAMFPEEESLKLSKRVALLNDLLKDELPKETEIAFERRKDPITNKTIDLIPHLLRSKVDVTGEDLQSATVSMDRENNTPFVSLTFNYQGGNKFARLTGDNVGELLAIVLDGVVHQAPVLEEKISHGQARITLGRGNYQETLKEAKELAIVLRAGALPAKLEFEEQRVVGPSLGADSIEAGKKASVVALLLILVFMIFYYKVAGILASFALMLNSAFIFAILIGLEATLTLPGVAGIALTIGMAVDANVIIYERIREELRKGKSSVAALDQGFSRAFRSILDANVTTAVAALVLMEFGTGPIRGFAVTLLIGIITSLFTAVFCTRLLCDWWISRPGKDSSAPISI